MIEELMHPLLQYQQYSTTFFEWWAFLFIQYFLNVPDQGSALLTHITNFFSLLAGIKEVSKHVVGLRSPVDTYYPPTYSTSTDKFGLLIHLHGFGSSGAYSGGSYLKLTQALPQGGYVLMLPNAIKNVQGTRYWKGTDACCDVMNMGVNDAKYIRSLIKKAVGTGRIDPNKVFISGHSNGAFMSYRFACEFSDLIAGIIAINGATFYDNGDCVSLYNSAAPRKMSILSIHSTADATILYAGGRILGATYPSLEGSIARWQANLGCTVTDLISSGESFTADSASHVAQVYVPVADSCPAGAHIEHWKVVDGVHGPGFTNAFRTKLVAWMDAHPKATE
ncbi:hypothetical protein FGO68_gene13754 [Halteria grandinella]|uniref:Phospholipase/carboxylesterase/thioesterase domain-containing protein n=1 Tax=Halteria grandinella TaxID=5974 RepID=A0A8J8NNN9_HALGN|nr:hypothetical protein FGO68_gene13754 [Halteria grandinella]